jgi:hypothetical protein
MCSGWSAQNVLVSKDIVKVIISSYSETCLNQTSGPTFLLRIDRCSV